VALQERVRAAHEAEAVAWSDGYNCARSKHLQDQLQWEEDLANFGPPSYYGTSESNQFGRLHG